MQIALLSDIHGNLPALEAVVDDLPPVDVVVCLGDIVGYNPWPAACIEKTREIADVIIQGNHDRMIDQPEQYEHNETAYAGLQYAQSKTTAEQRTWLQQLPRSEVIADDFLCVHDHPAIQDRYVMPSEFSTLRRYLDEHSGLALGHTHIQHEATVDKRLIVNPGSVGQPRDGTPTSAYAILETDPLDVTLHRVAYDIDRVISRVTELDLPARIGTRLVEGE